MKHLFLAAAVLAILLSCNKSKAEPDQGNPYKSLELNTKSAQFARQGHSFAFHFLEQVNAAEKGNFIISPLSMQFLLGMVLDGARGETANEICRVLGYGAGEVDAVNEYCLSMLEQLPALDKKTTLSIANAIFVNEGCPLEKSYKSTVGKYYKAEVANLDFYSPGALKTINGWASKQTNGMIPKVLEKVEPNMLAYLLNALYFKSQWKEKFPKDATTEETFTAESGQKGSVRMMKQEKEFAYNENDIFQMVCMPYGNGAFSMYAFLPREKNSLADVIGALRKASWDVIRYDTVPCMVSLWLPKFESKFHIKLNDILSQMGMPAAFDSMKADFKAMSALAMCLSFVQQDAAIVVDEEGTEAAAVSVAGMEKAMAVAPGQRVDFHANRPFLYLITESSTGAILFAGKFTGK